MIRAIAIKTDLLGLLIQGTKQDLQMKEERWHLTKALENALDDMPGIEELWWN